ncbi:MAG: 6-bladed beta-propeller [Prevotellaceae bacterium]|jgi:hypothetical protein|nr:6-bladed beta-propeller [Prevotellaceae bacterium]
MKKYIIVLLVICISCCHEKVKIDIEIIQAKTFVKENVLNLFDEVKVVDLETTNSSLVGLYIDRIEIYGYKIFALNSLQSHNNILCFDFSGKYLFGIDRIGQGPGEYTSLYDFLIDKNLHHLVLHSDDRKFLHFDMQGNFLYEVKSDNNYSAIYSIYLNDSTYLAFNEATFQPDLKESLIYIDSKTMNIRHKSNDINEYFYSAGNKPLCINNDKILCLASSDTIYDISDMHGTYAKYFVYYTNIQIKEKERMCRNIDKMEHEELINFNQESYGKGESMWISAMYETNKYLVFSCMKAIPNTDNSINYALFYDKVNKKTYNSENIDFDGFRVKDFSVTGVADGALYCVLSMEITDSDKEKIKNSSVFSEIDRKKLIEHQDEDNPLILILK